MYGRVLYLTEEQDYERDKDSRLHGHSLRSGMHCVVRIKHETSERFGLEYGGIISSTGLGLVLMARRVCDGTSRNVPLLLGSDDMLMSESVPAQPIRKRKLDTRPPTTLHFPATPAFPEHPIGYILPEEFATSPIEAKSSQEHHGEQAVAA